MFRVTAAVHYATQLLLFLRMECSHKNEETE